jgi:hypothetical protein
MAEVIEHLVASGLSERNACLAHETYLKVFPGNADLDADLLAEDIASWWGCPSSFRAQNVYNNDEWNERKHKA